MSHALPDSLRLAWWATAWVRGAVVTDLMLDAVIGEDATHTVVLPEQPSALGLVSGLGHLRADGVTGFGVAIPVEGDLVGLGGPAPFNAAAVESGEAVLALDARGAAAWGLVPERTGAAVAWVAQPARRRQLPDVGEADRELRAVLPRTADALAALDVARWRPDVADAVMNLRRRTTIEAPPGIPERCVELASRALQAQGIVDLALEVGVDGGQGWGGAVSAHELAARREALVPLARAARRALVAAGSPEVWLH